MGLKINTSIENDVAGGYLVQSEKVKCGDDQRLNNVLPTVYGDDSGIVPPTVLLTQEEYDTLISTDAIDERTLYLVYEGDSA